MKRVLFAIFFIVFIFSTISYFTINSSFVIDKVSRIYLPKFHIEYKEIRGNAIEGITLDKIYFNGSKLADSISIRLNPISLLAHKFTISKLHFIGVDKETLLDMVDFFSNQDKNKSNQESSDLNLPLSVEVQDIKITTLPFKESGVEIKKALLSVDFVELNQNGIDIGKLIQKTYTSLGNLEVIGFFKDGVLSIDRLNLKRVNALSILALTKNRDKNVSKENKSNRKKVEKKSNKNQIYSLKEVRVKRLHIDMLPETFQGVKIKDFNLDAKALKLDLEKKELKSLEIVTKVNSNICSLKAKILANKNLLNVKGLLIDNLSVDEVSKLVNSKKNSNKNNIKKDKKSSKEKQNSEKVGIPFLPRIILINKAYIKALPTKVKNVKVSGSKVFINSLLLKDFQPKKGQIKVKLSSNLAYLQLLTNIKNETIFINGRNSYLKLKDALFKEYKIDFKKRKLSPIILKGKVDKKGLTIYSALKGRGIISGEKIKIRSALVKVYGKFKNSKFFVDSKLKLSTSYTPKLFVNSHINLKNITYKAKIIAPKVVLKDKKINKLLGKVELVAKGSKNSVIANLKSRYIKAKIVSKDMKKASLKVTTNKIYLKNYLSIPKELSKSYAYLTLNSNLNLKKIMPIKVDFKLFSNLIDTVGKISYNKDFLSLKAKSKIPNNTILNYIDKNLRLKPFREINTQLIKRGNNLNLNLKSRLLSVQLLENLKSSNLKADITLNRNKIVLKGNIKNRITASTRVSSIDKFIKTISQIYKIDNPHIDGDLKLDILIDKLSDVKLSFASKTIVLNTNKREKNYINAVKATISKRGDTIFIHNYSLNVEDMDFFSSKVSKIGLKKGLVKLKEFWLNNSLKLTGFYNSKKSSGKIRAVANSFNIKHKFFRGKAKINVKVALNGKKNSIDGKITLLGGDIKYKIEKKRYIKDSDVVILQKKKKKKSDNFRKNFKIYLLLNTKRNLIFKNKNMRIKLSPKLSIMKEFNQDIKLLGSIDIHRGSYYKFENKKFRFQKSSIHFTGKANNPLLNIRLTLNRFGKRIKIYVAGKASDPSLNFSSDPPMSREQILSYILFDDENAVNGSNMVSALGGALAKSLLRNIGIKIDSMVIKSGGFEVGKKISRKVTILYDQSDEPRAILRIEHSHKFETDISVGEDSQSVDITFKKEF